MSIFISNQPQVGLGLGAFLAGREKKHAIA